MKNNIRLTMFKTYLSLIVLVLLSGCSSVTIAPEKVTDTAFPRVEGISLEGVKVTIPDDFQGKPTVLLIGYIQKAQFDIDRWILGLLQADVPAEIVELPTIAGMMPQMVQGFINNGMRRGIPETDWAAVVTIYQDADKIVKKLGNERPQNAYVVLLDKKGEIVWTANSGYSAGQILDLKKIVVGLK
jgi:hypothetical protein